MSTNLGRIIKQRRISLSLSLRELEAKSGVSISHLGRIETGDRFPSAHILQKIAKPLGFEENELFTLAGYLSPQPPVTAEQSRVYGVEGLDPYVAGVLAQESVEVQRTVIGILLMLKSLDRGTDCDMGFAEYARRKYPFLDEDLITMIEDLIKRSADKEEQG